MPVTDKVKKVYLVGAGPGDPGLITQAARDSIANAEVIVYDHLLSPELLEYRSPDCEIIYAGKHPGCHSIKQEKINKLLIRKYRSGKNVVRLKGGDPFLFGRGSEEAEELAAAGVPFEIIPGISSGTAAAAYAGIPLTHRRHASQVTFVTGHEDDSKKGPALDWGRLAKTQGTLVIFMGMGRIGKITTELIRQGMSKDTPAAVVRWGTLPEQKTITGKLFDIAERARKSGLSNPALIIIGGVVGLRRKLNWFESKPLFGKKILITRPQELAGELRKKLIFAGAQVGVYPLIEIVKENRFSDREILKKMTGNDWIIFTSRNAVEICFEILKKFRKDIRQLSGAKNAALGSQTGEELKRRGLIPDLVPKEFVMEGLLDKFSGIDITGKKIFLPHSRQARSLLCRGLKERGARVEEIFIYRVRRPSAARAGVLKKLLEQESFDLFAFTSSSCVHQFMKLMKKYPSLIRKQRFAAIGPVTAGTLSSYGCRTTVLARKYTAAGLADALGTYYGKTERSRKNGKTKKK